MKLISHTTKLEKNNIEHCVEAIAIKIKSKKGEISTKVSRLVGGD